MAFGAAQGRSGSGFLSACAGAANGSTAANPNAATAICKGIDRIMSVTSEQRRCVPASPSLWPQQLLLQYRVSWFLQSVGGFLKCHNQSVLNKGTRNASQT